MEGRKDDGGKLPWHLLPFDALKGIVSVLQFGAAKYVERTWEKGIDWDRVFGGVMRHLTDWWNKVDHGKGPGKDKDTGYSELWHAGCGILFLMTYELRGVGKDTRPKL